MYTAVCERSAKIQDHFLCKKKKMKKKNKIKEKLAKKAQIAI